MQNIFAVCKYFTRNAHFINILSKVIVVALQRRKNNAPIVGALTINYAYNILRAIMNITVDPSRCRTCPSFLLLKQLCELVFVDG